MWGGGAGNADAADAIIAAKGLRQISDEGAIDRIVDEVLAANPAIVAEFRAGKDKAFNSLVGKAMAASKGKANPAQVNAALKRKLSAERVTRGAGCRRATDPGAVRAAARRRTPRPSRTRWRP